MDLTRPASVAQLVKHHLEGMLRVQILPKVAQFSLKITGCFGCMQLHINLALSFMHVRERRGVRWWYVCVERRWRLDDKGPSPSPCTPPERGSQSRQHSRAGSQLGSRMETGHPPLKIGNCVLNTIHSQYLHIIAYTYTATILDCINQYYSNDTCVHSCM